MRLGDVKIGDKFWYTCERMYLRIDMDLKVMLPTLTRENRSFANLVPCLDLITYRVMCLNGDYEVEVEYDNVYI